MPPKNASVDDLASLNDLTTLLFLSSKSTSTRVTTTWRRRRSRTSSSPRRSRRRRKSPAITFPLLRICRRGKPRWWPASWRADHLLHFSTNSSLSSLMFPSLTHHPLGFFFFLFCSSFTLTFYLRCIIYTENRGVQVPALGYG